LFFSGEIDENEMRQLVKDLNLNLKEDQIRTALSLMDDNGDEKISKTEFLNWFNELKNTFSQ